MYERTTGQAPFALPKRWLDAKSSIDLSARANFTATTDIIGGNSGSPMVNSAGQIVGLVFDGNLHSIAGSYWFDLEKNRTIAVHPEFMRTALTRIYPSKALAAELGIK
jgi:V8-like Glu-specific endopeptidase